MAYTIWSNGRVIAETDLEQPVGRASRQGEVRLAAESEMERDFFLSLWAHMRLLDAVAERQGLDQSGPRPQTLTDVLARLRQIRAFPEARQAADAVERFFLMRLELRDDEGNVVEQEDPLMILGADAFCTVSPEPDDRRLFTMVVPPRLASERLSAASR